MGNENTVKDDCENAGLGEEVKMLGEETRIPICNVQMKIEGAATNLVKTAILLVNTKLTRR
jgi:hypothetical protein